MGFDVYSGVDLALMINDAVPTFDPCREEKEFSVRKTCKNKSVVSDLQEALSFL